MKKNSDNIVARGGICAVHNLNAFTDDGGVDLTQRSIESFQEAMRRASILGARALTEAEDSYMPADMLSLAALSIPVVEPAGDNMLQVTAGILLWGGLALEPGTRFGFPGGRVAIAGSVKEPPLATVLRAEMSRMTYDTYNALELSAIDPKVLRELDVELDPSDFDEYDDSENISAVKYISVYAPDLGPRTQGRAYATLVQRNIEGPVEAPSELGFDHVHFDELHEAYYDQVLVQFSTFIRSFAYVAIELINVPATPQMEMDDVYGNSLVDREHIARMRELHSSGKLEESVMFMAQIAAGDPFA